MAPPAERDVQRSGSDALFTADDEDQQVDDQPLSGGNCAYRRWLPDGYRCCHPQLTAGDVPD
ncbi:hypothetical protein FCL40_00745 [Ferrimonas sediminicola]|uniref:Uncharacterized protein n=1 Tax=Ferrimonas sediminicola TaxID=2569538 RepID=A0A4U1BI22_9GAMM|nr:hypothetical protein [Ferrimonas sediminicola]TKB51116.1 hypothetical protein FCL40_00745 [Ferrimonas sediminicola]